jgi:hypothetical protein
MKVWTWQGTVGLLATEKWGVSDGYPNDQVNAVLVLKVGTDGVLNKR